MEVATGMEREYYSYLACTAKIHGLFEPSKLRLSFPFDTR